MKQATVIKWLSKTVYCYKCFAYAICKIFGLVIILMDKEKKQVPAWLNGVRTGVTQRCLFKMKKAGNPHFLK